MRCPHGFERSVVRCFTCDEAQSAPKRRSAEAIARRRAKATEWRRNQRRRQREAELANAAPVPTPPAAEPRTVRKRRVQYHHLPHQPAVDSTVYRQYGRRA